MLRPGARSNQPPRLVTGQKKPEVPKTGNLGEWRIVNAFQYPRAPICLLFLSLANHRYTEAIYLDVKPPTGKSDFRG